MNDLPFFFFEFRKKGSFSFSESRKHTKIKYVIHVNITYIYKNRWSAVSQKREVLRRDKKIKQNKNHLLAVSQQREVLRRKLHISSELLGQINASSTDNEY